MRCLYKPWTWFDDGIHGETLAAVEDVKGLVESLIKKVAKQQETFETYVKEQAKNTAVLENKLAQKTQFIENMLSTMLTAKLANGHDTPANGKGTLVDISVLSATQQEYVQKQLKTAGTAKKLP